jgi:ATP-binding cassette subfamily B protein RaxB
MPVAYNSLIGDMGTSLAGGQKQRMLLARALYRRPRLLFTRAPRASTSSPGGSHRPVKALGLTPVVIAHRPETVASAPRQLVLHEGELHEWPERLLAA